MSRLAEALRRKYRTPADALRAIGVDPNLLNERNQQMSRRYGYDRRMGRDEMPETADEAFAIVQDLLRNLQGEEGDRFASMLSTAASELQNDPELGEAQDRRRARQRWGMDSRLPARPVRASEARAFDARYPSASKIGLL